MYLTDRATEAGFASLVGVSQQAINKSKQKGTLPAGADYRVWLTAYCDHLRSVAAGRGGENQESLTEARTQEALAKAAMTRLQYNRELGAVVAVDDATQQIADWATYANREFRKAVTQLCQALETAGIAPEKVDFDDVFESVFERVADYAKSASSRLRDSSEGLSAS